MLRQLLLASFLPVAFAVTHSAIFDRILTDDMPDESPSSCPTICSEAFIQCHVPPCKCIAIASPTPASCRLVTKRSWSEKAGPMVELFVRRDALSPTCNASSFPDQRGRSRYYFGLSKKTWSEAATHCVSLGGKLAQISSLAELVFIQSIIAKHGLPTVQIIVGLYQRPGSPEPAGGWEWHLSKDAFEVWGTDAPSNTNNKEHFGTMVSAGGKWTFNDIPGSMAFHYVCECFVL